ncbi:uncharacterized protein LOC131428047 [Malaya genurostris]|uniref:uncharacterized protein LOC131428047 n=1 Tax=Malaya genurostris TaxID=325434 RepID=UPI0026F3BB21|nr:uncharacterized protein LOC131428047 [Malaya genurostris]
MKKLHVLSVVHRLEQPFSAKCVVLYDDRMQVKCKKCSHMLIDVDIQNILAVHQKSPGTIIDLQCATEVENNELFIHEDHLSDWMHAEIERSQWTKGKFKCFKCGNKIGSFDFVSGSRCKCEMQTVLPSVHFIRSKVDLRM